MAKTPWSAQRADALIDIARTYSAGTGDKPVSSADTYQVVVHVDSRALTDDTGRSDLPLDTMRRLCCDGGIVTMVDDPRGEPLSVGRKQRTVPSEIKRVLWARDCGCSFPGCTNKRFNDAHYVRHWSRGGATSVDNLTLLCSAHHRLVHEGGYEIGRDIEGRFYFKRPDGRAVPPCGYKIEDITDDNDASAEACETNSRL